MRVLILNTDYEPFIQDLYLRNPGLERLSYEEQMRVRNESLFGVADFYSNNLRKLGREAWDVHANNEFMQKAWAREHGLQVGEATSISKGWLNLLTLAKRATAKPPLRYLRRVLRPLVPPLDGQSTWVHDVLAAQIMHYRPDVLLNQDMGTIGSRFLKEIKPHLCLLVGQIASPLPHEENFGCYDLVLSSLPNLVDYFRRAGVPSELHRLGFEPTVLNKLDAKSERIPVSFVGSLSAYHDGRIRLLEHLCARLEMEIWGQGVESLPKDSPISQRYKGKAWGNEMYQILCNSKITLNHHIRLADSYANNMRLFEATGVGTLLLTDSKVNLDEMFEPGKEIVAYRTPEECAALIQYYLEHDNERRSIGLAGQQRTLRDHTYHLRMKELVEIIDRYMRGPEKTRRRVFAGA